MRKNTEGALYRIKVDKFTYYRNKSKRLPTVKKIAQLALKTPRCGN